RAASPDADGSRRRVSAPPRRRPSAGSRTPSAARSVRSARDRRWSGRRKRRRSDRPSPTSSVSLVSPAPSRPLVRRPPQHSSRGLRVALAHPLLEQPPLLDLALGLGRLKGALALEVELALHGSVLGGGLFLLPPHLGLAIEGHVAGETAGGA